MITADAVVLLLQSVWNGRLSVQEVLMLRIGGRLFVVPTAAASAPHPNLNLQMLAQAVVVGKGDTVEEREAAGNNTWGGYRGR